MSHRMKHRGEAEVKREKGEAWIACWGGQSLSSLLEGRSHGSPPVGQSFLCPEGVEFWNLSWEPRDFVLFLRKSGWVRSKTSRGEIAPKREKIMWRETVALSMVRACLCPVPVLSSLVPAHGSSSSWPGVSLPASSPVRLSSPWTCSLVVHQQS